MIGFFIALLSGALIECAGSIQHSGDEDDRCLGE